MLLSAELEPIIGAAYSEGQARFGNLGLELETYTQRVYSIVRKHLGASPSPQAVVEFVKGLHGSDLYLATSCAQNCPGSANGNAEVAASENASIAWKCWRKPIRVSSVT